MAGQSDLVGSTTDSQADAEAWLRRYRPRKIDTDLWDASLRALVLPSILALEPAGPAIAGRYARALARLASWSVTEGLPLNLEVVLDPDTVERFTSSLPNNRSTGTD